LAKLADDAFLLLHDGVKIHTVAHFGRHIPAKLRTALELGPLPDLDGVTCVEEGCERRYGSHWDRVDPIAHRGPTSVDNLEPRCGPDHRDQAEIRPRRTRRPGRASVCSPSRSVISPFTRVAT
jgi:hypothetical protein